MDGGVGGVLAREGVYQGFVVLMGLAVWTLKRCCWRSKLSRRWTGVDKRYSTGFTQLIVHGMIL